MGEHGLLSLDYRLEGEELVAEARGPLGTILQPTVDKFVGTLNGLKVIAKKDGMNVYNLYNPPQPSMAGMRHLFRTVKKMVYGVPFPGTANLAITLKCQCKCVHCSADPFRDSDRRELTTDELKSVVDQAQALGWGAAAAGRCLRAGGSCGQGPGRADDIHERDTAYGGQCKTACG